MKSVAVRCPECNASLEAGAETREIRCSYCNTLVVIQRRTAFFQRPQPLPERPAEAPPARVATEEPRAHRIVGVVFGLLLGVVPLVAVPIVLVSQCSLAGHPWGSAVMIDQGDHFIAVLRSRESEIIRLAAFESKSGKRRWKSAELRRGTENLGVLPGA